MVVEAQTAVTVLLVPAYLAVLGGYLTLTGRGRPGFTLLVHLGAAYLAVATQYVIWGMSSGMLIAPDDETVLLMYAFAMWATVVVAVPTIAATGARFLMNRGRAGPQEP